VTAQRGQVYRCDLGQGLKPWLVVSNNGRNQRLDTVIAIRITTTARDLPTWVELSPADPLTGYALADDIEQLYQDELGQYQGGLTRATMARVNHALGLALALI
jgi:mRNA interferase MazF